jgi:hypothetical protein
MPDVQEGSYPIIVGNGRSFTKWNTHGSQGLHLAYECRVSQKHSHLSYCMFIYIFNLFS